MQTQIVVAVVKPELIADTSASWTRIQDTTQSSDLPVPPSTKNQFKYDQNLFSCSFQALSSFHTNLHALFYLVFGFDYILYLSCSFDWASKPSTQRLPYLLGFLVYDRVYRVPDGITGQESHMQHIACFKPFAKYSPEVRELTFVCIRPCSHLVHYPETI